MRHKRNTQTLSRFSSYYKATIKSLAQAVILRQRIVTTKVRAKLAKRLVDNLVTIGKDIDSLASRRRAFSVLNDHSLVQRLFKEISPMFTEKNGGYTRIIPYKRRRGDNAELVVLELSLKRAISKPVAEKQAVRKEEERRMKEAAQPKEEKAVPKVEHKEVLPPEKEKHKKEAMKPHKKNLGGFGKFFKQKKDSA